MAKVLRILSIVLSTAVALSVVDVMAEPTLPKLQVTIAPAPGKTKTTAACKAVLAEAGQSAILGELRQQDPGSFLAKLIDRMRTSCPGGEGLPPVSPDCGTGDEQCLCGSGDECEPAPDCGPGGQIGCEKEEPPPDTCLPFKSCGDRARAWLAFAKDALAKAKDDYADNQFDLVQARDRLNDAIHACYANNPTLPGRYECLRQVRSTLFAALIALERNGAELKGKIAGLQALIKYLSQFLSDLDSQDKKCDRGQIH